MNNNTFKSRLKKLRFSRKLVFLGAFIGMISVVLPWYMDIDRFNLGDTFLGITGPLYLAGFIVLVSCAASFIIILLNLLEKKVPKLPLSEEHLFIFSGGLSLLMLILTSSVYFHTKFGINITDKSMGIGMILAFASISVVIVGGILCLKNKNVVFEEKGHIKPLIDMETQERAQNSLENDVQPTVNEPVKDEPVQIPIQESITSIQEDLEETNDYQSNGQ